MTDQPDDISNVFSKLRDELQLHAREDDAITFDECNVILERITEHPNEEELALLFRKYDPEGSGGVSGEAFCRMMAEWLDCRDLKRKIKEELDHWQEPDYLLSMAEFREELGRNLDAKQIDDILRDAGVARNTEVTIEEYKRVVALGVKLIS